MRAFNAEFVTEKNKRIDGPTPVNLLTFSFAIPVYISDRDITPSGGALHLGLIKEWSFIDSLITQTSGSGVLGTMETSDFQLTIINSTIPRFSDNFTEADPLEGVTVELSQFFIGLSYAEREILFKGIVAGQPEYDEYECRLTIKGVFEKYNQQIGEDLRITIVDFPCADPDDMGEMLPLAWGAVKKCSFRALDAGVLTTTIDDISASQTSIKLTDSNRLPSTGTIQVGAEQIAYTGNTSNQLTGCTRGANSTIAVKHNSGASAWRVQAEYIYMV